MIGPYAYRLSTISRAMSFACRSSPYFLRTSRRPSNDMWFTTSAAVNWFFILHCTQQDVHTYTQSMSKLPQNMKICRAQRTVELLGLKPVSLVMCTHMHACTHARAPFSGTTQVSQYQKGKTNPDFTEARDSEWQRHQLGHMQVCTSLQTDNHARTPPLSFYRPDALSAAQTTASKH